MTNKQIVRMVVGFRAAREGWLAVLNTSDSVDAAQHVLAINSKIELLLNLWNWSDETVDYPHNT